MTTGKALNGKPYAGNPHVRFDEGEDALAAMPRRGSLLYKTTTKSRYVLLALVTAVFGSMVAIGDAKPYKCTLDDEVFKGLDYEVIAVGDKSYMFKTMLADVKLMIHNGVKYVEANPEQQYDLPFPDYMLEMVKKEGLQSKGLSDYHVKAICFLATQIFVNKKMLLDRAAELGLSSNGMVGIKSPSILASDNGFSREVLGRGTVKSGILKGTSLELTADDMLLIEEVLRREAVPKDYKWPEKRDWHEIQSEENTTSKYLRKLRKNAKIDSPDYKASVVTAFARKTRETKAENGVKHAGNAKPKLTVKLVRIPAGANAGEEIVGVFPGSYKNTMKRDMEMDATEITFADWKIVKEWAEGAGYEIDGGESSGGDNYPVVSMSLYDCWKWCNARSELEGLSPVYKVNGKPYKVGVSTPERDDAASGYRLPTMNEWQYAARGGRIGFRFPWGDTISHAEANYYAIARSDDYELSNGPHPKFMRNLSGGGGGVAAAAPVASFKPNGYGLYDMSGNVWELVDDMDMCRDSDCARMCGGCFARHGHFAKIRRSEPMEQRGTGADDVGFRTMRPPVVKKAGAGKKITSKKKVKITINTTMAKILADQIKSVINGSKEELKASYGKMKENVTMGTFPSSACHAGGESYSIGKDYIGIWYKAPALDVYTRQHSWRSALGEQRYEKKVADLREREMKYLHAFAIYPRGWYYDEPIPLIVITVESSTAAKKPFICAFTPDAHLNFGNTDIFTSDGGMLANIRAVFKLYLNEPLKSIGDVEDGKKAIMSR